MLMRLHGTRLETCFKNINKHQYAFNSFQMSMLPKEYRPPPAAAGKVAS